MKISQVINKKNYNLGFTAQEAVSKGDPVFIKQDSIVEKSKVYDSFQVNTDYMDLGTPACYFDGDRTNNNSITALTSELYAVAYTEEDANDGNKTKAVCKVVKIGLNGGFTVLNTYIMDLGSHLAYYVGVTRITSSKFLFCCSDHYDYINGVVGSIDNELVSYGTLKQIDMSYIKSFNLHEYSSTKAIMCFFGNNNAHAFNICTWEIDGTSLQLTNVTTKYTTYNMPSWGTSVKLSPSRYVLGTHYPSSSDLNLYITIFEFDGASFTGYGPFAVPRTYANDMVTRKKIRSIAFCKITESTFFMAYVDCSSSCYIKYRHITVNTDHTITMTTYQNLPGYPNLPGFVNGTYNEEFSFIPISSTETYLIAGDYLTRYSIVGTTLSTVSQVEPVYLKYSYLKSCTNVGSILMIAGRYSNTFITYFSMSSNTGTLLGIAQDNAEVGEIVTIAAKGDVSTAHTDLEPLSTYYIDLNGNLTTEAAGVKVGKALNSKELLISALP